MTRPSGVDRHLRVIALALVTGLWIALAVGSVTRAAEPSPSILGAGDPRSEGEGPGGVDVPILVAAGVVALGVLTAGLTLLYLRLAGDE